MIKLASGKLVLSMELIDNKLALSMEMLVNDNPCTIIESHQ